MSQLNLSFLQQIKAALDATCFTSKDFTITTPESGNRYLLIQFRYIKPYSLNLYTKTDYSDILVQTLTLNKETRRQKHNWLEVATTPGNYRLEDIKEISDLDDVIGIIPQWCNYIKRELESESYAKLKNPIEELRDNFEKKFDDKFGTDDQADSVFDSEEIDNLTVTLNELLIKIEGLQEKLELSDKEIIKIKQDFEELKRTASYYPKGAWKAKTKAKIFDILTKGGKVATKTAISETVKKVVDLIM